MGKHPGQEATTSENLALRRPCPRQPRSPESPESLVNAGQGGGSRLGRRGAGRGRAPAALSSLGPAHGQEEDWTGVGGGRSAGSGGLRFKIRI